jgi:hypothetical protein
VLASLVLTAGCGSGTRQASGTGGTGGTGGSSGTGGAKVSGAAGQPALPDAGQPPMDTGQPQRDSGPVTCPTSPPYDESDQALLDACTRPVVVGVGNGLRRIVSYDGQTWQYDVWFPNSAADQNENSHRDVAIANGLIVIVGDSGILVSADGGATYTNPNTLPMHVSTVSFFKGAFWVISSEGTFSSSDGVTWTEWDNPGEFSGRASATDGQRLVAINSVNNNYRVFDGSNWTTHTLSSSYGSLGTIGYGGGLFVMLGDNCCDTAMYAGLRAASSDGAQTFTLVTNASPGAADLRFGDAVIWTGAAFFAPAGEFDTHGYDSTDGLVWTAHQMSSAIGAVAQFQGAIVGSKGTTIYRSTDETNWTATHTAVGDAQWGFSRFATGHVLAH